MIQLIECSGCGVVQRSSIEVSNATLFPLSCPNAASLKSFGEKTASLFDRKKKDAEKLAADKAAEAQKIAEEQARKVGEEIGKTKSEAEALASSTGIRRFLLLTYLKYCGVGRRYI